MAKHDKQILGPSYFVRALENIISLTLFLIFLLIFFRDFSSALVRGNFDGIGYPSDIRVFFSSSVKIKTPHPSV